METTKKNQPLRYTYEFPDTKIIFGADQQKHGIVSLKMGDSPLEYIRDPYYGLNVYRLMSGGRLMAIARTEPFKVQESSDSSLTLDWEPTEAHPVKISVTYKISESIVDFTLHSETLAALTNYEISICTYFDFSLEPYAIIGRRPHSSEAADLQLLKVEDHPYIKGYYVCFPRDAYTTHIRTDGRWRNESTGQMIAHHVIGPYYGRPVAIMANEDSYVVQMADSRYCNGIDTTYSSLDQKDNIMLHNALYFNLFGEDMQPGDRRTARMRQVLCKGKVDFEKVLELYDEFLQSLE